MIDRRATIDAALDLVAEKGWTAVGLRDIAAAAGVGLAALYVVFPSKIALVSAFMAGTDAVVLEGVEPSTDPDETARDRLFDVLMQRYELLKPRRAALEAIARGVLRDPVAALALRRALLRSMGAMLEAAGISADGARGAVRKNALAMVHIAVSRVWSGDESADMSKTMVALDHRLKRLGRWSQSIDKIVNFRKRRTPTETAVAPEAGG